MQISSTALNKPVLCPICQSNTSLHYRGVTSVYSKQSYDVGHCPTCNHFFTTPLPNSIELDNIYKNKYSYDAHALIEAEKKMRARNYADYIAKLPKMKTALEVGCMHGLLLTELQARGLAVSGVELDPEAVKYCQAQGLDVVQGSIEDHLEHATGKHDAVIMSHVLEHIVDPRQQLEQLAKRMSDDGRLVLIVPNSMAATRKLFGRYWGYWQVPVHINHFNEKSMTELLGRTGFKVTDTQYFGGDSLFFLSTLANMLGSNNDTKQLSPAKKMLVRIATVVLRPWYFIGKEDMLVVAKKAK